MSNRPQVSSINEYENTELVKAILTLTRNERIVIILNIVEGMTPKEISDIMGIGTNNVYVQSSIKEDRKEDILDPLNSTAAKLQENLCLNF